MILNFEWIFIFGSWVVRKKGKISNFPSSFLSPTPSFVRKKERKKEKKKERKKERKEEKEKF